MSALIDSASLQSEPLLTEAVPQQLATTAVTMTTSNDQAVCTVIENLDAEDSEAVMRNRDDPLAGDGVEHFTMVTVVDDFDNKDIAASNERVHVNEVERSSREGKGSSSFQENHDSPDSASGDHESAVTEGGPSSSVDDDDDGKRKGEESTSTVFTNVGAHAEERDGSGDRPVRTSSCVGSPGDKGGSGSGICPKDVLFFMRDQQSQDQIKQVTIVTHQMLA